ncbi:hypothetical protein CWRG_00620 [Chthonomonas calidirosea]|uniref:hypothetical protein n=1 Tax=Chthonomonas calidirosea TaxID=454171 RepID=UPI0006DD421C|nr:hypothetical protein [Chthonomonas calidirosea]CEK13802.1 hypothetical protein CWRG_00620 [Chthonomonas calidirosea]
MEVHIKILAWLHIIFNAIYAVLGISIFLLFLFFGLGTSALIRNIVPAFLVSGMGAFFGFFFLIFGLPGLVLGYGLLTERGWSRALGIVFSLFDLLNFPMGTILGIYGLIVLFNEESSLILSR